MSVDLQSPYVYFGGKSKIAADVWQRLGNVDTYVEPFFGSGAVLLANPNWQTTVETINDLNHYIANFWRAVKADPAKVAEWADYPVVETDLHARHVWLVNEGEQIIKRCASDPNFYDAKVAGWWVWGMALWIGGGFCDGTGGWNAAMLAAAEELGTYNLKEINRQRPHLRNAGQGVSRQRPHLSDGGQGVKRQLPHLVDAGQGVNRKLENGLQSYVQQLSDRMRRVRVCCGDWERIVKPAVTWAGEESNKQSICGIFLDPPYSAGANRDMACYGKFDSGDVAQRVHNWCVANGNNKLMRIALCGYDGTMNSELEKHGWSVFEWTAAGGYSTFSKQQQSKDNRARERVWFSPHCLTPQRTLFDL